MAESIEPGRIMPSYSQFLVMCLKEIWGTWNAGKYEDALRKMCLLITFSPVKIKKKLGSERIRIVERMKASQKIRGVDFYTTNLVRNRQARQVAFEEGLPFLDKITTSLDEWGWLEKPRRRVSHGRFEG